VSTITIELPDEVVPSAISPEEFARELLLAAAIHWYSRGQISQGKGAQIAGMDRRSFILASGPCWRGRHPGERSGTQDGSRE